MIITPRLDFDRVSNLSKQISAHLPFLYNTDLPLGSPSSHLLWRERPPGQELTLCSEDRAEGREHSCPCQLPRRALSRGFPLCPGSRPWCSFPIYFLLPSLRARTKYSVEKWCKNEATWSPSTEVTAMLKSWLTAGTLLELTAVDMWVGTSLCPRHNFQLKKGNWECAEHALLLRPYPSIWAEVMVGFPSLVGIHGMNTSARNTDSPLVPRLPQH